MARTITQAQELTEDDVWMPGDASTMLMDAPRMPQDASDDEQRVITPSDEAMPVAAPRAPTVAEMEEQERFSAFAGAMSVIAARVPDRDTSILIAARDEARATLVALEVELAQLPGTIQAAALAGKSECVVSLTRRYDELPVYLHAARMRAASTALQEMEARTDIAEAQSEAAASDADVAGAALRAAQAVYDLAASVHGNYTNTAWGLRMDIAEKRRELQRLIASTNAPPAPVVRSLPHAR